MLWYLSCADWHDARYSDWIRSTSFGFGRGGSGGVFSFEYGNWNVDGFCGRGVAVVGTGLLYSILEGKALRSFLRIAIYKRNIIPSY